MKCPKCGKEIANDSNFCEFCGAQVRKRTSSNAFGGFLIVMALLFVSGLMYVIGFFFVEKKVPAEYEVAEVEEIECDTVPYAEVVEVEEVMEDSIAYYEDVAE